MDQTNTQGGAFDSTDTLSEDQLDQMEQSDRLGGAGTLLGNESVDQVDGTDQNELAGQSRGQTDATRDVNLSSGMPTDASDTAGDTSTAWSPSSGLVGATPTNTASANTGLEGNTAEGASNAGDVFGGSALDAPDDRGRSGAMEDAQVQRVLDPNGQGNGMGNGGMAKDPVCGMLVDTTTAKNTLPAPVGSQQQTLYFCSPECKALFEANPEQYIANY